MSSKKLLFLATLCMGMSLQSLSAQETSSFCEGPVKRICEDTTQQRKERDDFVEKLKSEIAQEADIKAAPRIEEMKKNVSRIHFIKRLILSFKIRNQEIMNAAKKRVNGIESVVTSKENVALLKQYMKEAIDQTNFNETVRANFKSTIDKIVIGNFADFIEKSGLEDNFLAQLLNNACGSDGMISNAFATTIKDEKYVLICPGFLITLSQTADEKERFNSIIQGISHEMGHHIDNSVAGTKIYKPFLSCLANHYGQDFNKSSADKRFCKKNAENVSACNMQVVESHAGELIADAWGIKATEIHAKKQNYSTFETERLLINTWSNLCDSKDEGIHPSGNFRMGTLLRKTPGISDFLLCNNSNLDSRPGCTFEGATLFN